MIYSGLSNASVVNYSNRQFQEVGPLSILTLITAQMETLTHGERAIASVILDRPEDVTRMSSTDLASAAGRSQSGVIKLCQKLGFNGYQDLRLDIARATASDIRSDGPAAGVQGTIEAGDDLTLTMQKLLASKTHAMRETLSVNPPDRIDAARDALSAAARVQLAGVGASSLVARDLSYKLQKLAKPTLYDADSHAQIALAATLGPHDMLLAFSESGKSPETLHIARTAGSQGARIVTITGLQANRLADLAGIALRTVADEERVRSSAITSRDAQLILTDLLFLRLVQTRKDAADLIRTTAAAVGPLKL